MGLATWDAVPKGGRRGCVLSEGIHLSKWNKVGNELSFEFSKTVEAKREAAIECLHGRNHQLREKPCSLMTTYFVSNNDKES